MKPYFHKAEHFTPNPDYDIDNSVSMIPLSFLFLVIQVSRKSRICCMLMDIIGAREWRDVEDELSAYEQYVQGVLGVWCGFYRSSVVSLADWI